MTVARGALGVFALMFGAAAASAQPPQTQTQTTPEEAAGCPAQGVFWLCVSPAYQPVIEGVSLTRGNKQADPDAVKKLGIKISIISYDLIVGWNPSPENKFCAGTDCMYYLKSCAPNRCSYKYGIAAPSGVVPYPENMAITYATDAALHGAEHNIFLALGPAGSKTLVPLSDVKTGSNP